MSATRLNGDGSLFCIGLTTVDVVALPVPLSAFEGLHLLSALQMAPAGTAAGAALVAARLGVPTRLAGSVGADAMGRFIHHELEHAGVDVSLLEHHAQVPTSATLIPIDAAGMRRICHAPGAALHLSVAPAALAAARNASAVHYAGIGAPGLDGGAGANLLAQARAAGALTTCDLISPGPAAVQELKRLLPHVQVFLPSAVEARFATGESDLERAAAHFREWGAKAIVIKNGDQGALAWDLTGAFTHIAALPTRVIDTTTCGDSFCAGFIAATLRGRPWNAALRFATATASLVAQGPATLGRLESFAQVDALLKGAGS